MIGKNIALLLLFSSTFILAQVSAKIQLSKEDIFFKERTELYVFVSGGERDSKINLQSLDKDFVVQKITDQSRNSEQVTMINNEIKRVVFRGHVFVYGLTPKAPGNYSIEGIPVTVNGTTVFSNRVALSVSGPETGENVFVKTASQRSQYFMGETFLVTAEIYIRGSRTNWLNRDPIFAQSPPQLKIPWIGKEYKDLKAQDWKEVLNSHLTESDGVGFNINGIALEGSFFSFESTKAKFKLSKEFVREEVNGKTNDYVKYTISRAFEAKNTGVYVFEPISLSGTIVLVSTAKNFTPRKRVQVAGKSLTIEITDMPTENRPQDFKGTVGHFNIQAKILKKTAYVGDLLDLVVTISGSGKLDSILAPKLSEQTQISSTFKVYDDNINMETTTNSRKFQYSIRAHQPTDKFPKISFSYFDTRKRDYTTIFSQEIPIEIKEVQTISKEEIIQATKKTDKKNIATETEEGLFANYEGLDALQEQATGIQLWHNIIVFAMPITYAFLLMFVFYQKKWGSDLVFQRKRKALSRTEQRLLVSNNASAEKNYEMKLDAIKGYVADHFNLNEEALVSDELLQTLKDRISNETSDKLRNFLETCESVRYGVVETNVDINQTTLELLQNLHKELNS
ncbi:BatD family protein [Candidatus Uabimicrobium sp. HlEnr_7]|uniref:BatD family protein n=1 Tax=Candidatus Uabimicrobium helgolandensis TaxID=3095367 RepID=UPI003558F28C